MEGVFAKRLQTIKELPVDDPNFLMALDCISDYFVQGDCPATKHPKENLQERHLQCYEEFLHSFHLILDEIQKVEENVIDLKQCCQEVNEQVEKTQENSKHIISYIDTLQTRKNTATANHSITNKFVERLQHIVPNARILHSGRIDGQFFSALQAIRGIASQCQQGIDTQPCSAIYTEIRNQAIEIERTAVDRLHCWTMNFLATLSSEIVRFQAHLVIAFQALETCKSFHQQCVSQLVRVRISHLNQNFSCFIKQEEQDRGTTPTNSDPVRLIVNILTFVHRYIANECELLKELLTQKTHLERVVVSITSSVCPLFVSHVSQKIEEITSVVVFIQLANVFFHYSSMFSSQLEYCTPIHDIFGMCKDFFLNGITLLLRRKSDEMFLNPTVTSLDSSPPSPIRGHVNEIAEILKEVFLSLEDSKERENIINVVLTASIQPLVQFCLLTSTGLDEANTDIYKLNCLGLIDDSLATSAECPSILSERKKLGTQIERCLDRVIQTEVSNLIQVSQLEHLWKKISPYVFQKKLVNLAEAPGLEPYFLEKMVRNFEASVSELLWEKLNLIRIQNLHHKERVRSTVIDAVSKKYHTIYNIINDPICGYTESSTGLLRYRVDQFHTLLNTKYK